MENKKKLYKNKGYVSVDYAVLLVSVTPLKLKINPKSIKYWDEYFSRYKHVDTEGT